MYETREEANQKLVQTVALYNNRPVYIQDSQGSKTKLKLLYQDLRSKQEGSALIWDQGWEFRNFGDRLGYTNAENQTPSGTYKEAVYLSRVAVRKAHQTQGLSAQNLKIPKLRGCKRVGLPGVLLGWGSVYHREFFLNTLEKTYPTLPEVYSNFLSDNELVSKAFSRQLAIRRPHIGPFFLEYRGKDIGYTDDFGTWKISPDFSYLRESLEDIHNLNIRITDA